jgi:hypothetical protein
MMDAGVGGIQLLMPARSCTRLTPKFLCLAVPTENPPPPWLAPPFASLSSLFSLLSSLSSLPPTRHIDLPLQL